MDASSDSQDCPRTAPSGDPDWRYDSRSVAVGTSCETSAFAVDAVTWWWKSYGQKMYARSKELLILAGCDGPQVHSHDENVARTEGESLPVVEEVCKRPSGVRSRDEAGCAHSSQNATTVELHTDAFKNVKLFLSKR
jgi:Rhodopirellula transposase DDE domain